MTIYPTKGEIIDAITQVENLPDDLIGYKCAMGAYMPLYYQGGFCLVFKMLKENAPTLALRVWFAKVDDIIDRNKTIAAYIQQHPQEYLVKIKLYEKGLKVPSDQGLVLLDMMTMEWVEGENLKTYIKNILESKTSYDSKKDKLISLANKMLGIFESMHQLGMSHGDLQHTNILISLQGNPKLIDYDSLYFPNSKYTKHITDGYSEYQHPSRRKSKEANERTDYFSELIIYLAIMSYAEDNDLWKKYAIDALDYSILFTAEELQDIENSVLYNEIKKKNDVLSHLCQLLYLFLSKDDIDDIERPFTSYEGISIINDNYCIECGYKFINISDRFCICCGTKRM